VYSKTGELPTPNAGRRTIFEAKIDLPTFTEEDRTLLGEAIGAEVTEALEANGLSSVLPPVSVELVPYLYALVISPREAISPVGWGYFFEELSSEEIELIEEDASYSCRWYGIPSLNHAGEPRCVGYLSRVRGLATRPPKIALRSDPRLMLNVAAHEWAHSYLDQYPLGSDPRSSDMLMVEEGVARIVGEEICTWIFQRYGWDEEPNHHIRERFRSIHAEVDRLLAEGRIVEAETYMEEVRIEICATGPCPRKINQAFFAALEPYGWGFEGSNPTPQMVRELRAQYPTLGKFLEGVRVVGSQEEFLALCEEKGISPEG